MLGIGFGSGGSHITYAMDRGDGVIVPEANECGDSISDARGARSSAAAIRWIVDVIKSQPDDEICAWIGAAGFSGASAAGIRNAFASYLPEMQSANKNVEVLIANDAVSLLKAAPLSGSGVVAVVGTGSIVMGAHPNGASLSS
jgi:N-acetylglucosamine kinase-like BadF-type ATPase